MTKPKVPIKSDGASDDRRETRSSRQLESLTDKLEHFTDAVRNSGDNETKQDNSSSLYTLVLEIKNDIKVIKPDIQTIKNDIQALDHKFSARLDNLEGHVMQHETRITKLEENVDSLKSTNVKLVEKNEYSTRAKQAILSSSLIDSSAKNFVDATRSLLKSISTPEQIIFFIDISRLGNNKNVALLSFPTLSIKSGLFKVIKEWNKVEDHARVYLNDFLTEKKLELFKKLRKLKAEEKIFSVYSFRNGIYIKTTEGADSKLRKSMEEITQYM